MVLKNLFQNRKGINKGFSAGGFCGHQNVFPCPQMIDGLNLMGVQPTHFQLVQGLSDIVMKGGWCSVYRVAGGDKMFKYKGLAEIGVGLQGVDESGKFHVAYFFSVDGSSEAFFFPNFFSRASLMSSSFVLGRSLMII